jgi:NarL family two-component system sensor histidine kinase LiaS
MASVWRNLSNTFRQLRWKLTLSYTAVTVGALLVVLLALALLTLPSIVLPSELLGPGSARFWVDAANEQAVPLVRYLLTESPPNMEGIAAVVNSSDTARFGRLDLIRAGTVHLYIGTTSELDMLIIGPDGSLLGRTGFPALPDGGQPFDANSIPGLEAPLQAALVGEREPDRLVAALKSENELIVAVPVFGMAESSERLLGVVAYATKSVPTENDVVPHTLALAGRSIVLFILGAAIMGAVFGSLTARRMVRRLRQVEQATDSWSRGDFSVSIEDPSEDEIGQLARRLNGMAEELQHLLERREEMAISEERNRLARDLHDSAKQQALAASFQLGTAITLYEREPQAAKEHLTEADSLLDAVRTELTDLIHELRPTTANGRELDEALNEYAIEWAHQNEIEVDVVVEGHRQLSLETEQALLRIAQEALANISRHSRAGRVVMDLSYAPDVVSLSITDDGCGFDTHQKRVGLGLHSMRERTESLGGSFTLESRAGEGTTVAVVLPAG